MKLFIQMLVAFVIIGGVSSCRTTKKIQTVITTKKDSVQVVKVEDPQIRFNAIYQGNLSFY